MTCNITNVPSPAHPFACEQVSEDDIILCRIRNDPHYLCFFSCPLSCEQVSEDDIILALSEVRVLCQLVAD